MAALEVGLDRAAEHPLGEIEDAEGEHVQRRDATAGSMKRRYAGAANPSAIPARTQPNATQSPSAGVGEAVMKCDGGVTSQTTAKLVTETTAAPAHHSRSSCNGAAISATAAPVRAATNAVAAPPPTRNASARISRRIAVAQATVTTSRSFLSPQARAQSTTRAAVAARPAIA